MGKEFILGSLALLFGIGFGVWGILHMPLWPRGTGAWATIRRASWLFHYVLLWLLWIACTLCLVYLLGRCLLWWTTDFGADLVW